MPARAAPMMQPEQRRILFTTPRSRASKPTAQARRSSRHGRGRQDGAGGETRKQAYRAGKHKAEDLAEDAKDAAQELKHAGKQAIRQGKEKARDVADAAEETVEGVKYAGKQAYHSAKQKGDHLAAKTKATARSLDLDENGDKKSELELEPGHPKNYWTIVRAPSVMRHSCTVCSLRCVGLDRSRC